MIYETINWILQKGSIMDSFFIVHVTCVDGSNGTLWIVYKHYFIKFMLNAEHYIMKQ